MPPHSLAARADQHTDALQHFLRGLAREGQEQYVGRVHTGIDQVGNSVHEGPRLTAARPRNHQRRTVYRCHGRVLLRIELLGIIQGELSTLVLVRSPLENIRLNDSVHVGIRLSGEAHDGSGRAV